MTALKSSPLALLALLSIAALAQQPSIDDIVNGASYASYPYRSLAAGSVATIFGSNLASDTLVATDPLTPTSTPLPTELGGTSVVVDGTPAPLFFVSPDRIDFQISWKLYGPRSVVVTSDSGSSEPYSMGVSNLEGPGIFTADRSGCGQGAILNVADDGSTSPNCPVNSVAPGGTVTIFAVGLWSGGLFAQTPQDGVPTPSNLRDLSGTGVNIGGKTPHVLRERLAPGLVGIGEIDAVLDADTPESCAVPVQIRTPFVYSQIVSLSVHAWGGQCVDPPPQQPYTIGTLEWRRTVATGIDPPPPPETFTANFTNVALPDFYPPSRGITLDEQHPQCTCYLSDVIPLTRGKPCPPFADVSLDAGVLTLYTPDGNSIDVPPSSGAAQQYQIVLPANTITGGTFTVAGAGGNDIGGFQSDLSLPPYPPISITTDLSPGTIFPQDEPFTVTWTGGRAGDTVHMQVFNTVPGVLQRDTYCDCAVPATDGKATLPTFSVYRPPILPVGSQYPEIRIVVQSEDDQVQNLTIPGLTQGAQHRWVYEWRFGGVKFVVAPQPPR